MIIWIRFNGWMKVQGDDHLLLKEIHDSFSLPTLSLRDFDGE